MKAKSLLRYQQVAKGGLVGKQYHDRPDRNFSGQDGVRMIPNRLAQNWPNGRQFPTPPVSGYGKLRGFYRSLRRFEAIFSAETGNQGPETLKTKGNKGNSTLVVLTLLAIRTLLRPAKNTGISNFGASPIALKSIPPIFSGEGDLIRWQKKLKSRCPRPTF